MNRKWTWGWRLAVVVFTCIATLTPPSMAHTLYVLHTFDGTDGDNPAAGLIQARDGNFYGTTYFGGSGFVAGNAATGNGVVYQLTPSGTLTDIYNFGGAQSGDGAAPVCPLVEDLTTNGLFYGTTLLGGGGGGTVFSVDTAGTESVKESFANDGAVKYPSSGLLDISGTLWGTSSDTPDPTSSVGIGTVFSYNLSSGQFFFTAGDFGNTNLSTPVASLILGQDGLFFGAAYAGGIPGQGGIFTVDPSTFPTSGPTDLYSLGTNSADGATPQGSLYQDSNGNFYFTTVFGGANNTGTVSKFTYSPLTGYSPVWTTSFDSSAVWGPQAALIMASDGFLYGTTNAGGPSENGDIYQVDPATGTITDIYDFNGTTEGGQCPAPLLIGSDGYLYGITATGGVLSSGAGGFGTIFKFSLDPNLANVSPTTVTAGNPGFTLTVNGSDFNADSVVQWNGQNLTTTFVSPTKLTAAVPSSLLTLPGSGSVDVQNKDGATSTAAIVTVNAGPTTSSISPTDFQTFDGFTLTVNGTNFVSGDTVVLNGATLLTTTFVSSTQLTATVPSAQFIAAQSAAVGVETADGVLSNTQTLTIHAPNVTSITPSEVTAGNPGFTITVNGQWFPSSSNIIVGTTVVVPTSSSSTQLVGTVPASAVSGAGTVNVHVEAGFGNPFIESNNVTLTVDPARTLTSISPTQTTAGTGPLTLTVNGTNFLPNDTVTFGSDSGLTQLPGGTSTSFQVTVPASDLTTAGTVNVAVVSPDGVATTPQTFTITGVPTISTNGLSPSSCTAGNPGFTLTVTGTNFVSGDFVLFGSDKIAGVNITSTSMTAAIPAADLTTAGAVVVKVQTYDGVTSNAQTFTVNPVPSITSISPTDVPATDTFTLTITGTNFISGDNVNVGGFVLSPAAVTSTSMSVSVPGSAVFTAGIDTITVVTADGVSSNGATLNVHAPTINSIGPSSATVGNTGLTLTISGTYFPQTSQVVFGQDTITPTSITLTSITAAVPAADLAVAGPVSVYIQTGLGDGPSSNIVTYDVNPARTLTSISPTEATAGTGPITLTVNGANFIPADTVTFGSDSGLTQLAGGTSTSFQVTVPASDLTTPGSVDVTVVSPDGVATAPVRFTIVGVPTISALSPTGVTAGNPGFTLTVTGTNFVSGDFVLFGSDKIAGTVASSTSMTAAIPAADVAAAGSVPVTVQTFDGVNSNSQSFTVDAAPTITSISPTDVEACDSVTVAVNGTNFVNGDTVLLNGIGLSTTFVSSTQVTADVTGSLINTPGSYSITVLTTDGVMSNAATLTVHAPTISTISPTVVTAGNPGFTMQVNGNWFPSTSELRFGSQLPLTPTSSSLTGLTVAIPSSYVSIAGSYSIHVDAPAGDPIATSNTVTLTVDPARTLTSISPVQATVGSGPITLTVNGTNFLPNDTVTFGADAGLTQLAAGTSTSFQVTVPASDLTTPGPVDVTVVSPDGVSTAPLTFQILAAPAISALSPAGVTAGHTDFPLTVTGTGFVTGDQVLFGTHLLAPSTNPTATSITVTVPAADVATMGTVTVKVQSFDGINSNGLPFAVGGAPTITSVSPTDIEAEDPVTVTINGTNFVTGDTVVIGNADPIPANVQSPTLITVALSGSGFFAAGGYNVVVNSPDGVSSNSSSITVHAPSITTISPSEVTAGNPGFSMNLIGNWFPTSSAITIGTNPALTPVLQSLTQLTVAVPASDVATAGTYNVQVSAPFGNPLIFSNTATLTVDAAPILTSISPNFATVGNPGITLSLTGTNFLPADKVVFGSDTLTQNAGGSSTQMTVNVPASDLSTAGTVDVCVVTADGVLTTPQTFTIAPTPTIGGLSPTSATSGNPNLIITISGAGFIPPSALSPQSGDTVSFGGNSLVPLAGGTSTQLQIAVPAADLATPGSVQVKVVSPDGVSSNSTTFQIDPTPTISSISPTDVPATDAFTLTVNGTGFLPGDTVGVGSATITPSAITATKITASVPANAVMTAGVDNITVVSADGVASNAVPLTVHAPAIAALSPASATAGISGVTLAISGTWFPQTSQVVFGSDTLTPASITQTSISVNVPTSDLASAGSVSVTVQTGGGSGPASNAATFTVLPTPVLRSLSPNFATAGHATFPITLTGANFVTGDTVSFGADTLTPLTGGTSTSLTVDVPAADIATAGGVNVTVISPDGVASNTLTFAVNGAPAIVSLSPTHILAQGSDFTLTITGTDFLATDSVIFGSDTLTPLPGTTPTQITVTVPAGDISTSGSVNVTVVTSDGISSNTATFTIDGTATLTSLAPAQITAGHSTFALTINGSNFLSGDTVQFGSDKITPNSGLTTTQLTANIPAADVATTGPIQVTVLSPTGVPSNALTFTVVPAPAITSISPTDLTAGHPAFTLTINGTNFAASDTVSFGPDSLTPTTTTSTQIQVTVPATDMVASGPVSVTVVTADGVASNAATFTVDGAPSITSLSPDNATTGGPQFSLAISGTNFTTSDTVHFGSDTLPVSTLISDVIQVIVPAADIAVEGSVNVTVVSPDGVSSNIVPFSIGGAPTLVSISPNELTAGHPAFTITATGHGFVAGDMILFGTDAITPKASDVTSTTISLVVPIIDIATAGTVPVSILTPDGVQSNALPFTLDAAPTLTFLDPSNTDAGTPGFVLAVHGANFTPVDQVQWNGTALSTTYVAPDELDASVTAADIAVAGSADITVTTPDGFTSTSLPFTVNAAGSPPGAPSIGHIVAASATAGDPNLTVNIDGHNFVSGDTVDLNSAPEATTFVSATQLNVDIPASSISTKTKLLLNVVSPLGVSSNTVQFVVNPVHTYDSGLQMVCVPYDYSGDALSAIIDEEVPLIAVWDPTNFAYAISPSSPADTLHQGRGAWANFKIPVDLLTKGVDLTASTGKLELDLPAGWNMIGDPYTAATPIDSIVVIDSNGNALSLAQANAKGIIYSTLFSYNTATGQYDAHTGDSMQPYTGYWIDAFQACKIVIPSPFISPHKGLDNSAGSTPSHGTESKSRVR